MRGQNILYLSVSLVFNAKTIEDINDKIGEEKRIINIQLNSALLNKDNTRKKMKNSIVEIITIVWGRNLKIK